MPQLDIFLLSNNAFSTRNRLHLIELLAKRAPWQTPNNLEYIVKILYKLMVEPYD